MSNIGKDRIGVNPWRAVSGVPAGSAAPQPPDPPPSEGAPIIGPENGAPPRPGPHTSAMLHEAAPLPFTLVPPPYVLRNLMTHPHTSGVYWVRMNGRLGLRTP